MSDTLPAVLTLALLLTVMLGATAAGAAHSNHSDDATNATDATDGDHDDGEIPWFPIITGGLLLLAVAIMVVRRAIDARQDDEPDSMSADDTDDADEGP